MSNSDVLRQCEVFSGLTSSELEKIANLASEREYEAGMLMFHEKDRADQVFILKEGKVALQMTSATPPRRTVTVDVASTGELVGWATLVEPHIHDMTALCLQKTRVLVIDANRLRLLMRDNSQTGSTVLTGMVRAAIQRLNDTRQLLVSERFWPQNIE